MSWYSKKTRNVKIANEFIGSDAIMNDSSHIQDSKVRNVDNQYLPTTIMNSHPNTNSNAGSVDIGKPTNCPVCKSELVPSEFKGFKNSSGEEVFYCLNCGESNDDYKRSVEKGGRRGKNSRVRRRKIRHRHSSHDLNLKTAASPANPMMMDYNNSMNTPYGRLDLSEDQRIMPWNRMSDGFWNEFNKVKQKDNSEEKKIIRLKNPDGTYRYVKIKKKKSTGGDGVQPANTYDQKGRVKKQTRFNPAKGKDKNDGHGAWPHNRDVGKGWYQHDNSSFLSDSDMKYRVMPWSDYVNDRGSSGLFR